MKKFNSVKNKNKVICKFFSYLLIFFFIRKIMIYIEKLINLIHLLVNFFQKSNVLNNKTKLLIY